MNSDALQRGRDFVASIMLDIEQIPNMPGTGVMRGVKSLTTGIPHDIFIRDITQSFWEECIRVVKTPNMWVRVCAVGTPGIGKTTSTPLLIRMLLEAKHTVVYRLRSTAYFWEFECTNSQYNVIVHKEKDGIDDIECLTKESTFYIVDPGKTSDDCVPFDNFACRTILVTSPNGLHWGGKHFLKQRENTIGRFRYFPMWDLDELLLANRFVTRSGLTEEEVVTRFRMVGGVPRHIVATEEDFQAILLAQNDALLVLPVEQVEQLVLGQLNAMGTFDGNQPKSAIIGYAKVRTQETIPFSSRHVKIVSSSVEEKVIKKFMGNLWNRMLHADPIGWKIFETYCRAIMATSAAHSFLCRPCCGKAAQKRCKESYVLLGGCHTIQLGVDPAMEAIQGESMTLFHSVDPKHELFDFIYKDNDGKFHAFQVTLAKSHKAKREHIEGLRRTLGTSLLALYYVIPADHHNNFVTDPVRPARLEDTLTSVWHILIPNPREESFG